MPRNERWGRPYPDTRDWSIYNDLLVQRGEFYLSLEILADDVIVAADSTGIKVTNRGEWMREKWGAGRGWIKVHLMIDVKTNQTLGLEITDEFMQDDQRFIPLLDQTQQNCGKEHPVYRVLADGAYDRGLGRRGTAVGIMQHSVP